MVWRLGACLRAGERLRSEPPEDVASHPLAQRPSNNGVHDAEHCWICLESAATAPLIQPCGCPRFVHEKCIARWQLQSAGKECVFNFRCLRRTRSAARAGLLVRLNGTPDPLALRREEQQCRFCGAQLPDWKARMTPANVTPCRTAVMAVVLNGQEHRITVEPGDVGRRQFETEIRRLFSLSQEDELEFTFDCQAPGEGAYSSSPGTLSFSKPCARVRTLRARCHET